MHEQHGWTSDWQSTKLYISLYSFPLHQTTSGKTETIKMADNSTKLDISNYNNKHNSWQMFSADYIVLVAGAHQQAGPLLTPVWPALSKLRGKLHSTRPLLTACLLTLQARVSQVGTKDTGAKSFFAVGWHPSLYPWCQQHPIPVVTTK